MVLIPRAASLSPAAFLPPPLHIQKKSRRAAYRRRRFRKPTGYQSSETHACGPLDDIIDEIQSNIWLHPPDHDLELANLDWSETLKPPPPCTITPLFVSSPPSEDTLKVRKSRNNRQSTSTSSMDNATFGSHWSSSDEYAHRKRASLVQETTPWPAFDSHTVCDNDTTGQQYSTQTATTQRRPSRLRLFTNGLARLRRTNTEETSASTANISPDTSPTVATSIHSSDQDYNQEEPSDEAIDAYVRRNARK